MTKPSPSANPEKEKRLNAMIADYLKRKDTGQKVNKDAMLKAHPDLADGLRSYFQGEAMIGENSPLLAATKLSPIPLASDVRETLKPGAAQACKYLQRLRCRRVRRHSLDHDGLH